MAIGACRLVGHFARDQPSIWQLAGRNVGVDSQVSRDIGDVVGFESSAGTVFECQVEALMFEQPLDMIIT